MDGKTSQSQSSQKFYYSFIVVRALGWIHEVQLSKSNSTIEHFLHYLLHKLYILCLPNGRLHARYLRNSKISETIPVL